MLSLFALQLFSVSASIFSSANFIGIPKNLIMSSFVFSSSSAYTFEDLFILVVVGYKLLSCRIYGISTFYHKLTKFYRSIVHYKVTNLKNTLATLLRVFNKKKHKKYFIIISPLY